MECAKTTTGLGVGDKKVVRENGVLRLCLSVFGVLFEKMCHVEVGQDR